MLEISLYLKISSVTILLFVTAKLFLSGRFSARALASGLFTLSIAGYLGCQICHSLSLPQWFTWLIHIGCFSVPLTFYLLAESLFEDKFKFRWLHLLLFIFIELTNFYLILYLKIYSQNTPIQDKDSIILIRALPQIISLAFIFVTVFKTLSKRKTDLVEVRRNFRLKFIFVTTIYILLVLVSELAYQEKKAPSWLDLSHATGILLTIWYFASKILSIKSGTLGEIRPLTDRKNSEEAPLSQGINKEHLTKLEKVMKVDKIYTQESLSIRQLAEQIQIQEYILRRLINTGLGYKNFNDYLNEIRINEACRILADKNQHTVPIIRIAMDLGFGSLAPFNKAFKERKSITPSEFRKISAK